MFIAIAAAVLGSTSPTPAITGRFGGYLERINQSQQWERFDLILTNNSNQKQSFSLCPTDADMVLNTKQAPSRSAFAIKFNEDSWSFNCDETEIAAGESMKVGMFFRPEFEAGPSRHILVRTNVGDFRMN